MKDGRFTETMLDSNCRVCEGPRPAQIELILVEQDLPRHSDQCDVVTTRGRWHPNLTGMPTVGRPSNPDPGAVWDGSIDEIGRRDQHLVLIDFGDVDVRAHVRVPSLGLAVSKTPLRVRARTQPSANEVRGG